MSAPESVVPGVAVVADAGVPYRRYGSARGAQWWIPDDRPFRGGGTQIYRPTTLGGRARRLAMVAGMAGSEARLDRAALEGWLMALSRTCGCDGARLAFYRAGEPPLVRASALVLGSDGRPRCFAKIGRRGASAALEHEHAVLSRLGQVPTLRGHVPRVFGLVEHAETLGLAMSLAPSRPGPARFGAPHRSFLAALQGAFGRPAKLAETALVASVRSARASLEPHLDPAWRRRFDDALGVLDEYADVDTVATLAHRDFAPWNTASGSAGLFVFDWEAAAWGYPAGIDAYHFAFMTALLIGRGADASDAVRWIDEASAEHGARGATALLLVYLLDFAATYHRLHVLAGVREDDAELVQAALLLDDASTWRRAP